MIENLLKNLYRTEWVKVIVQVILLLFLIGLQFSQPNFIHWSLQSVVLLLLSISLLFHLLYIYFLERLKDYPIAHYLVYFFDIIWLTILIYYFPTIQALFVFLYLIFILLSGLILGKMGALIVAAFTSLCFSFLLAFSPIVEGSLLFLSLGLNNLGFFLIALLSGTLNEQLKNLGTELKKKTKDLQILKDLNSLILENMESGLISFDLQNNVLLFNKSAEKILEKKIVESMKLDFLIPKVLKRFQSGDFNAKHPSQHIYIANNKTKNLLFLYSHIYDHSGDKIGGLLLFSDQTEFRKLEEENKQNEKLAAIGKLAAGIAHEIRNPLTSMSGSIQFLAANMEGEKDEERRLMKIILKEVDRLNNLVTEFLDFAKPEQSLSKEVKLTSLLKETISSIQRDERFTEDIKLETKIEEGLTVIGDDEKLKQVFINLLINALQAMENTSIKHLEVFAHIDESHILVEIRDSGEGMTDEVKKRLFEPFHTTKPKGTGLGLAMVHKILDHHRAKVEVESNLGEGSRFLIRFPLP